MYDYCLCDLDFYETYNANLNYYDQFGNSSFLYYLVPYGFYGHEPVPYVPKILNNQLHEQSNNQEQYVADENSNIIIKIPTDTNSTTYVNRSSYNTKTSNFEADNKFNKNSAPTFYRKILENLWKNEFGIFDGHEHDCPNTELPQKAMAKIELCEKPIDKITPKNSDNIIRIAINSGSEINNEEIDDKDEEEEEHILTNPQQNTDNDEEEPSSDYTPSCDIDQDDKKETKFEKELRLKHSNFNYKIDYFENIKKYLCQEYKENGKKCHFNTKSSYSFKEHINMHEKVKPYKCLYKEQHNDEQCDKAFTQFGNCVKHIIQVHFETKRFKCLYCEKLFTTKHAIENHILSQKNADNEHDSGIQECKINKKTLNRAKKYIEKI